MNGSTGFITLLVLGTFWTRLWPGSGCGGDRTRAVLEKINRNPLVIVDVRTPEEYSGPWAHPRRGARSGPDHRGEAG